MRIDVENEHAVVVEYLFIPGHDRSTAIADMLTEFGHGPVDVLSWDYAYGAMVVINRPDNSIVQRIKDRILQDFRDDLERFRVRYMKLKTVKEDRWQSL